MFIKKKLSQIASDVEKHGKSKGKGKKRLGEKKNLRRKIKEGKSEREIKEIKNCNM